MINDNIVISCNILITDLDYLLFNHTQAQAINFGLFSSSKVSIHIIQLFGIFQSKLTRLMDIDLDFVDPEKEMGLDENEEEEGVNQPDSGEKFNKCNQCDYASSNARYLGIHLKIHSGEKPNKCNQCDYASSRAGHLRKHLKMHTGEKSNKCNQCDFASLYAGNLRKHLKTHSGEKPNKCNQCDYASSQAGRV